MNLYASLNDEIHNILIAPFKYWVYGFYVFALTTIESALSYFFVSGFAAHAFSLTHTHHAAIHYLILLQVSAAMAGKSIRCAVHDHKFKESVLGLYNLRPVLYGMRNGTWWVDGGVLIDGSIFDTAHSYKFQNNIRIFAA